MGSNTVDTRLFIVCPRNFSSREGKTNCEELRRISTSCDAAMMIGFRGDDRDA